MIQAGGHQLLKIKGNNVVKPTKRREMEFYIEVLPRLPELQEYVPNLYGFGDLEKVKRLFTEEEYDFCLFKNYNCYIELENLVNNNVRSIIDIKLGSVYWKSDEEKSIIDANKEKNKCSICNEYKFRLDGYIINNVKRTKEECRKMSVEQVKDVLKNIGKCHIDIICDWLKRYLIVLKKIKVSIYGPSLLVVISGNGIKLKLIDFTVYEEGIHNDDLVLGIEKLINILHE